MDISDEELISDCESSLKQLDILRMLSMSTDSEVGFEKVTGMLNPATKARAQTFHLKVFCHENDFQICCNRLPIICVALPP